MTNFFEAVSEALETYSKAIRQLLTDVSDHEKRIIELEKQIRTLHAYVDKYV